MILLEVCQWGVALIPVNKDLSFIRHRERNDGLYLVSTYMCAKMVDELVLALLASIVFSLIVFYAVRLQGEWLIFWLVYYVTLCCGVGRPPLKIYIIQFPVWIKVFHRVCCKVCCMSSVCLFERTKLMAEFRAKFRAARVCSSLSEGSKTLV